MHEKASSQDVSQDSTTTKTDLTKTINLYKSFGYIIVVNKKHYRLEGKEIKLKDATDGRWVLTFRDGTNYSELIFGIDGSFLQHMIWRDER